MANQIFQELLGQLKADAEAGRKLNAEEKKNIYYDHWIDILKTAIDGQFHEKTRDNIKQMVDISTNVLKRVIKEISKVYKKPATRVYLVNEKENENYKKAIEHLPINLIMQETNRLTNLLNETLIYTVWRNNRIEYDIVTPDILEVAQNKSDPTKLDAIIFSRSYYDTVGDIQVYYVYYDVEGNHFLLNTEYEPIKITGNEKGVNPYNDPDNPGKTILPFTTFHRNYPIDSYWDETTGQDLHEGTKIIGVLLTYLNYLIKVATFKQLKFTGVNISELDKDLVLDPLYVLAVKDGDADIGVVDYQVEIKRVWDVINNKIGALANNYGLSLDNFQLTGDAQSGYALRIKNLGLEDIITDQVKYYRFYEQELFNITKIVNNTMNSKNKIPDNGLFKVDFAEIVYPENPEEIRKSWKFDISMGSKNIYDYTRFINPDVKDNKEAEKFIDKNVEINKAVEAEHGISVDKLLETAFKEEPLIK